jgi:hypothetical protein
LADSLRRKEWCYDGKRRKTRIWNIVGYKRHAKRP